MKICFKSGFNCTASLNQSQSCIRNQSSHWDVESRSHLPTDSSMIQTTFQLLQISRWGILDLKPLLKMQRNTEKPVIMLNWGQIAVILSANRNQQFDCTSLVQMQEIIRLWWSGYLHSSATSATLMVANYMKHSHIQ